MISYLRVETRWDIQVAICYESSTIWTWQHNIYNNENHW